MTPDKREFQPTEGAEDMETSKKQLEFVAERLEQGETINPNAAAFLAFWVRKAMEAQPPPAPSHEPCRICPPCNGWHCDVCGIPVAKGTVLCPVHDTKGNAA